MKKSYTRAISLLPRGSLIPKKIYGKEYYYLIFRDKGRVLTLYKGRVSEEEKKKYEEAKVLRAKYRSLYSEVKKEIKLLERVLRARELRSAS